MSRWAVIVGFVLGLAVPCAAQGGRGGAVTRTPVSPFRVVPSVVVSRALVREPSHPQAVGVQPAGLAPPKADKQGKGALIGAGIGFFAGLLFATSNGRSEGDGPWVLIIAALAGVVGMSIGASVSI